MEMWAPLQSVPDDIQPNDLQSATISSALNCCH